MRRANGPVLFLATAVSVVAGLVLLAAPAGASGGHHVRFHDDCDPTSFNAAIRPGTCVGHGDTVFDQFIAELSATKEAEEWKFEPSMLTVKDGRPVILENKGGETHTFTLVKAFGGGFVPALNALSGNPVPAGECAATLPDGTLVPQPPSPVNVFVAADKEDVLRTARLLPGRYYFQCCIHPWMRVVLTVK
jgi:plastocyanin